MSAIKGKNTKPELVLRKILFARGYRYRLYSPSVAGHPDIWMRKYNTAIFVHGCFWHRHADCKYSYIPKSRTGFWTEKFRKNTERDALIRCNLNDNGIKCIVIWECTIKKMQKDPAYLLKVMADIEQFLCIESLLLEV